HRVGLISGTPGEDQVARYLFSLIGLGTPRLQGRMQIRDRALLYYAGILGRGPRSAAGLRQVLSDYFQVQVEINQFVGNWCELEESQWTTIGESGKNQQLGRDTVVLGTQVWDQQARFEIVLGPLGLMDFESFLPTEWRFGVLCDLVRFYVKDEFEFNVRLILKAEEIPPVKLSMDPALSWTSWLGPVKAKERANGNRCGTTHVDENPFIIVTPDALRSPIAATKSRILYRLPRGKQAALLQLMKRSDPKNTVVMRQGDAATALYIIRRGKVQLSRFEPDG